MLVTPPALKIRTSFRMRQLADAANSRLSVYFVVPQTGPWQMQIRRGTTVCIREANG
jgi:hypothetical protein